MFCAKCEAWLGNLGEEPFIHQYVNNLADIFDEVRRVLRPDGLFWLNLGDTYYGSGTGQKGLGKQELKKEGAESYQHFGPEKGTLNKELPSKCMTNIPHRVVIELINRGWIHRQTIIWHKPNALPESVKDRPSVDYEYLFMLSKSPRYYYRQLFEPITEATRRRAKSSRSSKDRTKGLPPVGGYKYTTMPSELPNPMKFSGRRVVMRDTRNIRSVWKIPVAQYTEAHFAVFPAELIQRPIEASCPKGGIVLDPFMGTGTTALVARALGRDWVGIEMSDEYISQTYRRLNQ
jgi:DNA modification methylase